MWKEVKAMWLKNLQHTTDTSDVSVPWYFYLLAAPFYVIFIGVLYICIVSMFAGLVGCAYVADAMNAETTVVNTDVKEYEDE